MYKKLTRPVLGSTQPPNQWKYFLGFKRRGLEVNHPPPSSAEIKNEYNGVSTPHIYLFIKN
jgi:hypothetical protein